MLLEKWRFNGQVDIPLGAILPAFREFVQVAFRILSSKLL